MYGLLNIFITIMIRSYNVIYLNINFHLVRNIAQLKHKSHSLSGVNKKKTTKNGAWSTHLTVPQLRLPLRLAK